MQGLLVVFAPALLVLFALFMEHVESRLRRLTVQQDEVQGFIETHAPTDPLTPAEPDPLEASSPTGPPAFRG